MLAFSLCQNLSWALTTQYLSLSEIRVEIPGNVMTPPERKMVCEESNKLNGKKTVFCLID